MAANSVMRIEALGRDNYDTWKLQMRALLIKNDAWGYVSGEIAKPENAADVREWRTKDEKAKSDLILSIGASQLKLIKNCETSRELWIKLENTFQSKGPARKATLLKTLILKKMCEDGDVREHLHDFFDAVDKLSEMDVIINPDQLAIMMLYSLPSSFENFRVAIESRDELPTPENLRTKIVEEFDARKSTVTSKDQRVVGSRFVLRNKYNSDGSIEKRKARVVARGFSQRPGIDYHETFAPVARMSSIRAVLAIAAQRDMKIEQLDVATAYLNGEIEETIYMEAPEYLEDILEHIICSRSVDSSIKETAKKMLEDIQKPNAVCLLIKALYGLRQSGRTWHDTLKEKLEQLGAVQSKADPCVFLIGPIEDGTFIIVYVDDIIIASRDTAKIAKIKSHLSANFEIKDLGDVKYCLGLEFLREKNEIAIRQKGYINDILARFGMLDCKPVSTPMDPDVKLIKKEVGTDYHQPEVPYQELIGALMYLATSTRPDIAHAVSRLSQFNNCYTETHWRAAKRVLRYLKGTNNVGLVYSVFSNPPEMFADADWGNCNMDRKSYTGYTFLLSGGAISWESKKQHTVALSTTEAEYMALSEATKEALYMEGLLGELGITLDGITIKNDNNGALKLAMNPVYHARSKHIDIRHHFVRDAVSRGLVKIKHVSTDEMTADILTKGLPRGKHEACMKSIGLKTIK